MRWRLNEDNDHIYGVVAAAASRPRGGTGFEGRPVLPLANPPKRLGCLLVFVEPLWYKVSCRTRVVATTARSPITAARPVVTRSRSPSSFVVIFVARGQPEEVGHRRKQTQFYFRATRIIGTGGLPPRCSIFSPWVASGKHESQRWQNMNFGLAWVWKVISSHCC